jgi:hypothetical protein
MMTSPWAWTRLATAAMSWPGAALARHMTDLKILTRCDESHTFDTLLLGTIVLTEYILIW